MTSDNIYIKIKAPNPSQDPTASSKAPNEDLKDMDVLCTFKIKIESQNLDHWCTKDQWPYPDQDQDAKPQSGTFSILQNPRWGLKGHGCSLHFYNQDWAKIRIMGVSKTSDHIQIKIKMQNPSQEPPASSKASNEDVKDMDDLCTIKITLEIQNVYKRSVKFQGCWRFLTGVLHLNLDLDIVRNLALIFPEVFITLKSVESQIQSV